jgi:hypothetical protein
LADSGFSATTLRIAVDLPLHVEQLTLHGVCDGTTWKPGEVNMSAGGFISYWVGGLPENADRANIGAYLGETRLRIQFAGPPDGGGFRQVNAALPGGTAKGKHLCRVECGGVRTEELPLEVV